MPSPPPRSHSPRHRATFSAFVSAIQEPFVARIGLHVTTRGKELELSTRIYCSISGAVMFTSELHSGALCSAVVGFRLIIFRIKHRFALWLASLD